MEPPRGRNGGAFDSGQRRVIRPANPNDSAAVAEIYAHHVTHGTASFDFEAPDADHWCGRIADIQRRGLPFLVCERDGRLLGYAYATQMRDRPGYRYTCEDSIYVAPDAVGRGVGRTLLDRLMADATACGFAQMIAVIGGAEPASVALHARCGFREVGRTHATGFKFGRWLDVVYMQAALDTVQASA